MGQELEGCGRMWSWYRASAIRTCTPTSRHAEQSFALLADGGQRADHMAWSNALNQRQLPVVPAPGDFGTPDHLLHVRHGMHDAQFHLRVIVGKYPEYLVGESNIKIDRSLRDMNHVRCRWTIGNHAPASQHSPAWSPPRLPQFVR
ncbi:MAG TPA: hypothetical protein VIQ48_01840 [Rhodanobacter sp.]|jgi:hypothetical protein